MIKSRPNYDNVANGVYILAMDKKLYTNENWNLPNDQAVGIAVIADDCRFVIAPDGGECAWCDSSYANIIVNGTTEIRDAIQADNYLEGKSDTDKIIAHLGTKAIAAYYCESYKFRDGREGYLGTTGEWLRVNTYFSAMEQLIKLINCETFVAPPGTYWWTTVQFTATHVWTFGFSQGFNYTDKRDMCKIRAFAPLI